MNKKVKYFCQIMQEAIKKITEDAASWMDFLMTASRFYKYDFHNQIMIYYQRPDATACAEYGLWNDIMHRYVQRGAKGIALLDYSHKEPELRYVFDVSDTGVRETSRTPFLWSFGAEHEKVVMHGLAEHFGITCENISFEEQIKNTVKQVTDAYWIDAQHALLNIVDEHFPTGYNESNLEKHFKETTSASIAYMILHRCGRLSETDRIQEDFMNILRIYPQAMMIIGTAIHQGSREIFEQIGAAIKDYERFKQMERSAVYGKQTDVHKKRRLSDSRSGAGRRSEENPGTVRKDAPGLSERASTDAVQYSVNDRKAIFTSDRGRAGDGAADGEDYAGTDASGGYNRGIESTRSNDMGRIDEQLQIPGRGNASAGNYIQLTLFPSEQEQIRKIDEGPDVQASGPSDVMTQRPVPDLSDYLVTRRGNIIAIVNKEPIHEIEITVSDEEYGQIQEVIPENISNFRISDNNLGAGGPKTKYQANVTAIRLLKALEAAACQANPEQQEVLSHYVGWGSIPEVFDQSRNDWAKEYKELKALLTPSEYEAARASTLNAHYTSPTVIRAIYEAVEQMGFYGGKILEPSCGIGNFFGMLPQSMSDSRLCGIELDPISGHIARQLYPEAEIIVAGFETTERQGFYDLAVGNVPFGHYQVNDKAYNNLGFSIHNYFFAKALDQVRSGGIIAFITSRYTMDAKDTAVRQYLAQRAELLGAIRLPNDTFKTNAGTKVVSDIIFLQKRDKLEVVSPDWIQTGQTQEGFSMNQYFIDHPYMVLGQLKAENTQYGKQEYTVEPYEGQKLYDQLQTAVKHIRGHYQTEQATPSDDRPATFLPAESEIKNYSYAVMRGAVYYRENDRMLRADVNPLAEERIKGLIGLRDCVHNLIALEMDASTSENTILKQMSELNERYDTFSAQYGLINARPNRLAFSEDSSYYLLCALEILDDDGKFKQKADMFSKRTIRPHQPVLKTNSSEEALILSVSERARVDLKYMSNLTGKNETELVSDLKGIIFKTPDTEEWQTSNEYLSGNIRKKLAEAKKASETDALYLVNVEALEKVLPKDLSASEIDVRLGATWIPVEYIQQFMVETLAPPIYLKNILQVQYSPYTADWNISGKNSISFNDVSAYSTYGTQRANAYKILEESLNLRDIQIYDTVETPDGKERRVLNPKETTLAAQKQQLLRQAFRNWIWDDPDRRQILVRRYNDMMNNIRPREYDGSHIVFAGMNPEISLREHQKNAIAHILYGGNTLLAHEVGAGKTFEMVAAAMESKRLGLCNKSLFVVPNHLTEQWASEFLRLYPSANILVATKKDFETQNRKKFCARIATGTYDAVIIGHSQFERIPVSYERQERLLKDQIREITDGIAEVASSHGERFTIKQMERTKKSLEVRLKKLQAQERKDDVICFEQLGVDRLFVDEAHHYKNLFFYTKMRNVAGLSATDAQKSSDMYAKCRYMDEITGGRGIIFATGTPVSNSMTELYTMQRYLQYDRLAELGLIHFDCWASTFGETTTSLELSPEGNGYRFKTRFSKFYNLPELMNIFKEIADIKTADQLHLPTPEFEARTVIAHPTDTQKKLVQSLSDRAAKVHSGAVDAKEDNMLKITSDGRKIGLDQRLINPFLPDETDTKVNQCVTNVAQIWEESSDRKLTQMIFCDISTPSAKKGATFNVYDDIREKLIRKGIPREQIAFIHDAHTELKKKELFAKVRSGVVRILIGSTQKMGAGTNVQDRLIALHDLDCPWRPGDLEQRKGRIVRQGNKNDKVFIYRYVTEGTFDSYLWQTVENKQKFIGQIMTSKSAVRSYTDVDETALSYAEIKALCAGDPRIKERMDLDVEVTKLKLMKSEHQSEKYRMEDRLRDYFPCTISKLNKEISAIEADIQMLEKHPLSRDEVDMIINGEKIQDRLQAGKALLEYRNTVFLEQSVCIGKYRGFDLYLTADNISQNPVMKMVGEHVYSVDMVFRGNNMDRLDGLLEKLPELLKENKEALDELFKQQAATQALIQKPFQYEEILNKKIMRLEELNAELNMDSKGAQAEMIKSKELSTPGTKCCISL